MPELNFKGKEFVYNHHLTVPFRPLLPDADKGIGEPSLGGNLIIHGDNLHGLKALLPTHAGKVDCIFIDPPYNTGNEGWSYNDNVNSPMIKEWLSANPIGLEDGLRHDKWACMMWPRLRLLHELLADDGSIWITLDDNEAHAAKLIMDQIFGIDNFHAVITWRSSDNSNNDSKGFSTDKNYILVYGKTAQWRPAKLDAPEKRKHFKNPDNDPDGPWFDGNPVDSPNYRENLIYDVPTKSGKVIAPPRNGWRWDRAEMERRMDSGEIRISEDETRVIRRTYLKDMEGLPPSDLWIDLARFGHNRNAKYELQSIFGGVAPFETPKPRKLIEAILEVAASDDALILDSFAGSGTTGHAVLAANARDGGNRQFILVEGEDYADRLTAERVRRVIKGYAYTGTQREELLREPITFSKLKQANTLLEKVRAIETLDGPRYDRIAKTVKDGALIVTGERNVEERTEGLGGTFTYCTLGDPIDMDGLLTGEDLPAVEGLAALLYHTATSLAFDQTKLKPEPAIGDGVMRLGDANGRHLWLIYKPDLDWLKSGEAALTLSRARAIAAAETGDHLVFAPAKFVSRELLTQERLPVEYAPLPFALYRVETA
ncbi:site-specific DNA-methyltransferase [Novosphingobium fluoreni]|uniref:site-specific DNA-methyltransferase n=1 Tax=Novosphingobium fluoreni TaxID=1391222 RepID=UPI003DA0F31D